MLCGKMFSFPLCYFVLVFVLVIHMKEKIVLFYTEFYIPRKNYFGKFLMPCYSMS